MAPWIIKKSAIKHPGLTTNRVAYEDTLKIEKRRRRVFNGKDTRPSTCTRSSQYDKCKNRVGQAIFVYTSSKQDGKFMWFGCFK